MTANRVVVRLQPFSTQQSGIGWPLGSNNPLIKVFTPIRMQIIRLKWTIEFL